MSPGLHTVLTCLFYDYAFYLGCRIGSFHIQDFSNVFRVPAIEEPGKKEKDCTESSPLALAMFFKDSVFEVDTFKDLYEIWSQLRVPFVSLWKRPPNDMRVDFRGKSLTLKKLLTPLRLFSHF